MLSTDPLCKDQRQVLKKKNVLSRGQRKRKNKTERYEKKAKLVEEVLRMRGLASNPIKANNLGISSSSSSELNNRQTMSETSKKRQVAVTELHQMKVYLLSNDSYTLIY